MNKWKLSFNHNITIFIVTYIWILLLIMNVYVLPRKSSYRTLYITNFNSNQSKSSIKYSIIINIVIIIIYLYYRIKQQNKNEDNEDDEGEKFQTLGRSIIYLITKNPYLLPILLIINILYLIRKLMK